MIQESIFGKACVQNFDQAEPVQKMSPIRNKEALFADRKAW